jgi:hypothetical protein
VGNRVRPRTAFRQQLRTERLAGVEATLSEWQEVLGIAVKFASNCAQAYRSANDRTRRLYNSAVFDELVVRGGEIADVHYRPPFELVFGVTEFEQRGMERETGFEPATSTLARLRSTE